MPRSKFRIIKLLLKIDARRLREKNEQKCIASNQVQTKMSLSVKSVVVMNFMCSIIKALHL